MFDTRMNTPSHRAFERWFATSAGSLPLATGAPLQHSTDPLTGLQQRLSSAGIGRAPGNRDPLTAHRRMIILDLDDLRRVNQAGGTLVGDRALEEIAVPCEILSTTMDS